MNSSNKPSSQLCPARKREETELEISAMGEPSQPDVLVKNLNPSAKTPEEEPNNLQGLPDARSFTNERRQ